MHWEPEGILQPPQRGFARTTNELYFGDAAVDSVTIAGPYSAASQRTTRRAAARCSSCRPTAPASARAPARARILSRLARRAYRRPVTEQDLETLLAFYRAGRAEEGFDGGIQRGLRRMLSSPSFLFRIEREPATRRRARRIASATSISRRVSRSSCGAAFRTTNCSTRPTRGALAPGRTGAPGAADAGRPSSQALVDNFASQWLSLGKLAGLVPDADAYPEFDENLRDAFRQETQLFVADQLREDRGVAELLTADYSFVNERLARHYRIPNVYGSHFRRVTFADGIRGGLLGQGSILAVTSYPNRTSPVVRGRWLLENILGAPPPRAAARRAVAARTTRAGRPRSIREQMEAHRRNPACAVCHVRMDPLGFSLENFDALGKWRTETTAVRWMRRRPARRHDVPWRGRAAPAARRATRRSSCRRSREAAGLRARARRRSPTIAGRARSGARSAARDGYRWSSLIIGHRHEHAVHDEYDADRRRRINRGARGSVDPDRESPTRSQVR